MSDDNIDVDRGDVFQTPDGPVSVVELTPNDDLVVTDPTVSNPIDSRAGNWTIERDLFESDLERGVVEPARLDVEVSE